MSAAQATTTRAQGAGIDPASRGPYFLAGVLTGIAGIVVSQVVATAMRADSTPVEAVAAAVRDLTPGRLAISLVHLVGSLDKPLLLAGTGVVLLVICGYAATWLRRRPLVPDLVFFALAAIGFAAVLHQRRPSIGASLAVVAGLITWIVVLRMLTAPLVDPRRESESGRRAFLVRSAWTVGGLAVLGVGARVLGSGKRHVEEARRLLRLPVHRGAAPAGVELGVPGIAPWRTPNADFYVIHTALAPPSITPDAWQLRIHGMVEREITLGYQALLDRQLTEAWITLCCVSNEVGGDLIGNAYWSGVLVRELLEEAGVHPQADAVLQTSNDGWTCGTPLKALTDDRNSLLAVAMNGQPLPLQHGFPVRTVVPGLYGYVSATKWVVDMEVTRFDKVDAFWTRRGWSEKGPVKTQSRVDVPREGETVKAGRVRVGGSAWAQHTGIAKVEFQVDGGPWRQAQLGRVDSVDTWAQWAGEVELAAGEHRVTVRATDRSGYTQTSVRTSVVPNGATGWHTRQFEVA